MADPTTPDVISPSVLPAAGGAVLRDLLVIIAAIPIVVSLIGAHDLTGLLAWVRSSDGATVLAILLPIVASGWRAVMAARRKSKTVTYARSASDDVVIVNEAAPPAA